MESRYRIKRVAVTPEYIHGKLYIDYTTRVGSDTLVKHMDSKSTKGFGFSSIYVGETLELPFKDNAKNVSSIPSGTYEGYWRTKRKFQLKNVEGRTGIQIHLGNYLNEIEGCILLGSSFHVDNKNGIPAKVLESERAFTLLEQYSGATGLSQTGTLKIESKAAILLLPIIALLLYSLK